MGFSIPHMAYTCQGIYLRQESRQQDELCTRQQRDQVGEYSSLPPLGKIYVVITLPTILEAQCQHARERAEREDHEQPGPVRWARDQGPGAVKQHHCHGAGADGDKWNGKIQEMARFRSRNVFLNRSRRGVHLFRQRADEGVVITLLHPAPRNDERQHGTEDTNV